MSITTLYNVASREKFGVEEVTPFIKARFAPQDSIGSLRRHFPHCAPNAVRKHRCFTPHLGHSVTFLFSFLLANYNLLTIRLCRVQLYTICVQGSGFQVGSQGTQRAPPREDSSLNARQALTKRNAPAPYGPTRPSLYN